MGLIDSVQVQVNGSQDILSALATYTTNVLKPNVSEGTNTLSQLNFDSRNVKYVIKWDYDLLGGTIEIPENCLIEFDGGSISNGTLIGNDTYMIIHQDSSDVLKNINLEGTFKYTTYRGPNLVVTTEAEYDSLDSYDENTIYFVKE